MFDSILVAVTMVALGIAAVMSIITWRVLSLERRRSDTRASELASAAARFDSQEWAIAAPSPAPAVRAPLNLPAEVRPAPPDLFTEPPPGTTDGRRLMLAVALGSAVLVLAFATVVAMNPVRAARGVDPPSTAPTALPVELVSLDHVRMGEGLSIRGIVRNPAGAAAIQDLAAVVFLFDRDGGRLGTLQAPVVATVLAPGREASFDVPVADGQRVARYRLSFRTANAPVPHVDRRVTARPVSPGHARVAAERHVAQAAAPASVW